MKQSLSAVAERAGKPLDQAELSAAHAHLLAARRERPTPFIDTTVYTNWNALAVSAYLEAARALHMPEVKAFAVLLWTGC